MNAIADAIASFGVAFVLISVVVYIWTALALGAVFAKSGQERWKAWVPILNQVVLFRLGGVSPLLLLLYLTGIGAIAVWVFQVIACHRINAAFRVGAGMTVLAALLLPVWASILGFGASRWVGEEEPAGPRRRGDDAVPSPESSASMFSGGAGYDPSTPVPPIPRSDEQRDEGAFHARSTHVPPIDPVFATSPDAVAPPAPAPGRPTPFAPSATTAPEPSGPVGPRAARSGSPVAPPAGGWAAPPTDVPVTGADAVDDDEADVAGPTRRSAWIAPDGARARWDDTGEVTGAIPGAPSPMSAVGGEPEAVAPPVVRVPFEPRRSDSEAEPWAPSHPSLADREPFAETSGQVSAIVGAPDAGAPRSARSSVSAQNRQPEIPEEMVDETIVARRRRTDWVLIPPGGDPIALGSEVVLLGRRPAPDARHPGAQLISIDDGTVSKTHARLELRDARWFVTDLDSTNGVVFATLLGTEVEAAPGVAIEAGDRFLLGDAEIKLMRSTE